MSELEDESYFSASGSGHEALLQRFRTLNASQELTDDIYFPFGARLNLHWSQTELSSGSSLFNFFLKYWSEFT